MITPEQDAHFWRPLVTLDLAGLSEVDRQEGSMFLGGSTGEFITDLGERGIVSPTAVVFKWGDPRVPDVFARLLEHSPELPIELIEFTPVALVGRKLWDLALQAKDFDPQRAYASPDHYYLLPYNPSDDTTLEIAIAAAHQERRQVISKIASRYVLFQMALHLDS